MIDIKNSLPFGRSVENKRKNKAFTRFFINSARRFIMGLIYRRHLKNAKIFFSQYPFSLIPTIEPGIISKPLSRYFGRCVNVVGRFNAIRDHYSSFLRYFSDDAFVQSHTDEIKIVENIYKGNQLALYLCKQDGFDREAEMRVRLTFNGATIVQMGMSFVDASTLRMKGVGSAIWIGIIKSSVPGEEGRENFRQFTKAFEGLRPKYAHVIFVQALAKSLNISEIFAPSYIGNCLAANKRFKQKVHADYDGFWEECGGERVNKYLYRIPCERQPRDLSEYKPNKRAQAKKRQDLELALRQSMSATFTAMMRHPATGFDCAVTPVLLDKREQ